VQPLSRTAAAITTSWIVSGTITPAASQQRTARLLETIPRASSSACNNRTEPSGAQHIISHTMEMMLACMSVIWGGVCERRASIGFPSRPNGFCRCCLGRLVHVHHHGPLEVGDGAGYCVEAVSDSERSAVHGRGLTGPPNETLGTLAKPTVAAGSDPRRSLYSTNNGRSCP
jgi:hypothetical protein